MDHWGKMAHASRRTSPLAGRNRAAIRVTSIGARSGPVRLIRDFRCAKGRRITGQCSADQFLDKAVNQRPAPARGAGDWYRAVPEGYLADVLFTCKVPGRFSRGRSRRADPPRGSACHPASCSRLRQIGRSGRNVPTGGADRALMVWLAYTDTARSRSDRSIDETPPLDCPQASDVRIGLPHHPSLNPRTSK